MNFRITNGIFIGAEVFIEPGQTEQEIDTWFRRLHECGMTITRIRLFENYMRDPNGNWDFSLFDLAYRAGEKYQIKIYGNLFPATSFDDVGGFKFPDDEAHLQSISAYISEVVNHFKEFESHCGWVPVNEPGASALPETLLTKQKFSEWKSRQKQNESIGYQHFDFAEERFLIDYNTWYLHWLCREILKHDPGSEIHVNNHAIFQNVAEYDFAEWRKFLTSFGGSAHASWHFSYFTRSQYALAVSANCEIVRSGAGEIPWLMTELQGGNNTLSAFEPLCPTKEEITQWLWITLASGGKGAIFWCLNPRMSGFEAGEWAMLNYQDEPSARMLAAAEVIWLVNKESEFFKSAKPAESGFNVLYIRESLWVEKKLNIRTNEAIEGRTDGAVMRSALTWFETLCEFGLQPSMKEISEFDFERDDFSESVIFLSHQISVPQKYYGNLKDFVLKGGKLVVDGLTAYYDEWAVCTMKNFPLKGLFGGELTEFKVAGNLFDIELKDGVVLPVHLWKGELQLSSGKSMSGEPVVACENTFGKGKVFWIPSPVGLGARVKNDREPLSELIWKLFQKDMESQLFRFDGYKQGVLMKSLQSGNHYLTVIINKSGKPVKVQINCSLHLMPEILWPEKSMDLANSVIDIAAEETIVLRWERV